MSEKLTDEDLQALCDALIAGMREIAAVARLADGIPCSPDQEARRVVTDIADAAIAAAKP